MSLTLQPSQPKPSISEPGSTFEVLPNTSQYQLAKYLLELNLGSVQIYPSKIRMIKNLQVQSNFENQVRKLQYTNQFYSVFSEDSLGANNTLQALINRGVSIPPNSGVQLPFGFSKQNYALSSGERVAGRQLHRAVICKVAFSHAKKLAQKELEHSFEFVRKTEPFDSIIIDDSSTDQAVDYENNGPTYSPLGFKDEVQNGIFSTPPNKKIKLDNSQYDSGFNFAEQNGGAVSQIRGHPFRSNFVLFKSEQVLPIFIVDFIVDNNKRGVSFLSILVLSNSLFQKCQSCRVNQSQYYCQNDDLELCQNCDERLHRSSTSPQSNIPHRVIPISQVSPLLLFLLL